VVKLTDDQNNNLIGYGLCPDPTVLSSHIGMKLNRYSIYYDGQEYSAKSNVMRDAIGLGYACSVDLPGKLSVDQTFTSSSVDYATTAGYFHNGDVTSTVFSNFDKRSLYSICDGYSLSNELQGVTNIGGDFEATNSEVINIAVRGRTGVNSTVETYGMFGTGGHFESLNSTKQNIGVYGGVNVKGSDINYGVYGYVPASSCTTGGPCLAAAGFFNGDVFCTSGNYWASDVNLKQNLQPIQNALSIVNSLVPQTFDYRTAQFPSITLPEGNQGGLIAQEVQAILPNLVHTFKIPASIDSTGNIDTTGSNASFLSVNYVGLIPYLIGAVKEQQLKIDSLKTNDSLLMSRMDQLEDLINNCCSGSTSRNTIPGNSSNSIDVSLSSESTIILNQNYPNPFAEQTRITFTIPENISEAKIIFFDNSGKVLQTVNINERGMGSINVYAEKLSSGIYSYTLIADNKVIDTKKMVCTK